MNKHKSFILFSFYEKGCNAKVQARVKANGTFENKGMINIDRNHILRNAKKCAKRRGMGFHLISLAHEGCGYHHVNCNDVVAIPMDIHAAISHELLDGSALKLEGVLG